MKRNNKQIMSVLVAATFLWTSIVWAPTGFAQSSSGRLVKPTAAQLELNDAGVQAIIAKDYDLAVQIFNSSLALGPINITYLNRGRALQHAGKCDQAEESYLAAYSAPTMAEPSAASVATTLDRYRKELEDVCPGSVLLKCEPREISVSINGRNIGQCPSGPIELKKGEYRIRGTLMGKTVESLVDVAPMKVREISLRLDASARVGSVATASPQGPSEPSRERERMPVQNAEVSQEGVRPLTDDIELTRDPGAKTRGALLLGTGIALLTTGIVMTASDNSSSYSYGFNFDDMIPIYLYSSGALFSIYGLVRLID